LFVTYQDLDKEELGLWRFSPVLIRIRLSKCLHLFVTYQDHCGDIAQFPQDWKNDKITRSMSCLLRRLFLLSHCLCLCRLHEKNLLLKFQGNCVISDHEIVSVVPVVVAITDVNHMTECVTLQKSALVILLLS